MSLVGLYTYYHVPVSSKNVSHYEKVLNSAKEAWGKVEDINKKIQEAGNEEDKVILIKEKHDVCKEQEQHLLSNCQMTYGEERAYLQYRQAFNNYRAKFFGADESEEGAFVYYQKQYESLKIGNETTNKTLNRLQKMHDDLPAKINSKIERELKVKKITEKNKQKFYESSLYTNLPSQENYKNIINAPIVHKDGVPEKQKAVLDNIQKFSFDISDYYDREIENECNKLLETLNVRFDEMVKALALKGLKQLNIIV